MYTSVGCAGARDEWDILPVLSTRFQKIVIAVAMVTKLPHYFFSQSESRKYI